MQLLRNISIRRKQTLIIMLTSAAALLLACAAFVSYDVINFRKEQAQRISSLAEVTANNCTAAVDFNDSQSAAETLAALRGEPEVIAACVYDRDGEIFAEFRRDGAADFAFPHRPEPGHAFAAGRLQLARPIRQDDDTIGTVFVASDLSRLQHRLHRYAGIVTAVFAASLLVALGLSNRLQKVVCDPILHLAKVARMVALEKNYTVRATRQSDDEVGHLIDGFNEMLAQILERDRALQGARDTLEQRVEERTRELAESLALLDATVNATADGILATDLGGNVVCCNRKLAGLWDIPDSTLESRDGEQLLAHCAAQMRHPEKFRQRAEELRRNPEAEAFDLLELADGRTLERVAQPQRRGEACVGNVQSFRDITERKKAEAGLEAAHRELVQASRHAGMAEVATNVLHNVGNVLNSVNTSASVIRDQIRSSKIVGVTRMAGLLDEHRHDLPAFFGQNGRADQVVDYLTTLSHHLTTEHHGLLKELDELARNIEHIKEIVAMQQSYAKVAGVEEIHSPPRLVEDALCIHATALNRHDVQVIRDFDPVPDILVDKHKVLQILVNLIGNAKYALSDSNAAERQLTLRVDGASTDRIRIAVSDNGVGIAPENLTRIFSHGFTTRKSGHGFGLHSGFLAAREMGGTLSVHSKGPNQGATFTLELPTNHRKTS